MLFSARTMPTSPATRVRLLAALTSLVLVVATSVPILAQEDAPEPTFSVQSTFEASAPDGAYELVQFILDFEPGAATPDHEHGGQVFVTVLSGEMTLEGADGSTTYETGDTWREVPGESHRAVNAGDETARIVATFLLPDGASLTIAEEGGSEDLPPGPVAVHQTRTPGQSLTGNVSVTQLVADFEPGAWTAPHEHGGRGVVTVVQGTLVERSSEGSETHATGDSWVENAGHVAQVGNEGSEPAKAVASFVVPEGVALTTPHESLTTAPASLPSTGGGPMDAGNPSGMGWLAAALVALGLLLGLRRRRVESAVERP